MTPPDPTNTTPVPSSEPASGATQDCETRYEALFSSIPAMLHSIDATGKILSVSELWLEKLGYSREEVVGRSSTEFLTEDSTRYARESVLPLFFAQGYCRDIHYQMVAKNGEILDVLLSATAEYAADGSIARSLAVLNDITPLKQVEQSLRESEQRLAYAFRGSRDGVWDWNATTGKVYYSKAWAEMLGYEEHELGNSFTEWDSRLHPEDREQAFASLKRHLKGESAYHEIMHRLRCKNGSYKWILSRGMVVSRDEGGAALRIIGTHTDLSEYKRIEQELERSQTNLQLAQRIAHIGSWSWDVLADSIAWSEETYRIFGEPPSSFTPDFESYLSRVHPEDKDMLRAKIGEALESGDSFDVEHRIQLPDGSVRYVHGLGQVQRDAKGQVLSMAGTVQDITDRRLAEDALRTSEEKFRAMSNACLDALIMIDAQDTIAFWSPAAEKMFGHTAHESLGRKLHDLIVPPEYRESASKGLELFGKSGQGPVIGSLEELPVLHKDGTIFPVERSVSAFTSHGKWYAVGMLRDITQRKEDEKRLTEMATTDGLTALTNRRHFMELAERACKHATRYHEPLTLLLFDIDHFKNVNDTYGHDVGDAVLTALAETFRTAMRETDILSRMGGEEFAACLPQTDLNAAMQAGNRLRQAIAETEIQTATAETLTVTVSIGLTSFDDRRDNLHTLLKRADQALYDAKHSGRNIVKSR